MKELLVHFFVLGEQPDPPVHTAQSEINPREIQKVKGPVARDDELGLDLETVLSPHRHVDSAEQVIEARECRVDPVENQSLENVHQEKYHFALVVSFAELAVLTVLPRVSDYFTSSTTAEKR